MGDRSEPNEPAIVWAVARTPAEVAEEATVSTSMSTTMAQAYKAGYRKEGSLP